MKFDTQHVILYSIITCFIVFSYWSWNDKQNNHTITNPSIPSSDTKPTEKVKCPPDLTLEVLEKERIKNKLFTQTLFDKIAELYSKPSVTEYKEKYPDWFTDPNTVILADKTIPAHRAETYVASTLNLSTGIGGITYIQKKVPYFGFDNKISGDLGYIFLGDKAGMVQAEVSYTPFRFGNFFVSGSAQIDNSIRGIIKIHGEFGQ